MIQHQPPFHFKISIYLCQTGPCALDVLIDHHVAIDINPMYQQLGLQLVTQVLIYILSKSYENICLHHPLLVQIFLIFTLKRTCTRFRPCALVQNYTKYVVSIYPPYQFSLIYEKSLEKIKRFQKTVCYTNRLNCCSIYWLVFFLII